MTNHRPHKEVLETALLRELHRTWKHYNHLYFAEAMRPPSLDLTTRSAVLAKWSSAERTIVFSRSLLVEASWTSVVEVLKHEMAHQYVAEVLRVCDETAHGPAFQKVCERHGIDLAARGLPQPTAAEDPTAKVVGRIQRLLALGGSPNENEARAAMNAAQRLMLEHNIAWSETAAAQRYGFRQLGEPALRVASHERILAGILGEHFFVSPVWVPAWIPSRARRGKVLEVSGSPANLETAEYVHRFLLDTAKRLWRAYKASSDKRVGGEHSRYLLGVVLGFREKLEEQARGNREEGLVWVGDAGLDAYVGRRHPRLRATRRVQLTRTPAYEHGKREGRKIRLRSGLPERDENRVGLLEDRS
ncbi:MAG: DUF2786 domain-containing protein [Deltaproteobacteria bacterium]|nr:DUF2786 domain-containing protein [Deltaproteobacteria bacterium]